VVAGGDEDLEEAYRGASDQARSSLQVRA